MVMRAERWYVARTRTRLENMAAGLLSLDGYQTFVPQIRAQHGLPSIALFPGYVFIRLDANVENWPKIRSIHGVIGWVNFGGDVPWLSDDVISTISETTLNQGPHRSYSAGDKVEIMSGVITGLAQVLENTKSSYDFVRVLLEFMGQLVKVQVPKQDVRALESNIFSNKLPRRTRGRGRRVAVHNQITSVVG